MFYSFKITPGLDENGKEVPIDNRHTEHSVRYDLSFGRCGCGAETGFFRHPRPFKCVIKPRLPNSAALVRDAQE